MPTFEEEKADGPDKQVTKLVYVGHSRSGKTGSLASLAAAGYNVRVLDLDRKVDVLRDYVLNKEKSPYRRACAGLWTQEQADTIAKRVSYVQLDETQVRLRESLVPKGDLWGKISLQLADWKDGTRSLGNVETWTPRDVLAIDGLSRLSMAAFTNVLALNGRLLSKPEWSDYGQTQAMVKRLMELLANKSLNCNVIIIAHIDFIETEGGPTKGFPQTVGAKLSPKISQDFSHAIMAKLSGQGDKEKRVIITQSSGNVDLGSAAPLRVKPEYDLSTGLAEYFRDIRQ